MVNNKTEVFNPQAEISNLKKRIEVLEQIILKLDTKNSYSPTWIPSIVGPLKPWGSIIPNYDEMYKSNPDVKVFLNIDN